MSMMRLGAAILSVCSADRWLSRDRSRDMPPGTAEQRRAALFALALVTSLLCVGGGAWARSVMDFTIDWSVLGSGGGRVSSASFTVETTIGQPVVGASTGGDYTLGAGFWGDTESPAAPGQVRVHLPIVLRNLP